MSLGSKRERVWNSQVRKSQKCLNLGTRRHFGEDFFAEERPRMKLLKMHSENRKSVYFSLVKLN